MIKRKLDYLLLPIVVLLVLCSPAQAEKYRFKFVDGLNRPLTDVKISVTRGYEENRHTLAETATDEKGKAELNFEPGDSVWMDVSKDGYAGFSASFSGGADIPSETLQMVLQRKASIKEISELEKISGKELNRRVLELLASDFHNCEESTRLMQHEYFKIHHHLEDALLTAADNENVAVEAFRYLVYFSDQKKLIKLLPKFELYSKNHPVGEFESSMLDMVEFFVVGRLIHPKNEIEWLILSKSLEDNGLSGRFLRSAVSFPLAINGGQRAIALLNKINDLEIEEIKVRLESAETEEDKECSQRQIANEQEALKSMISRCSSPKFSTDLEVSIKAVTRCLKEESDVGEFKTDLITINEKTGLALVSCSVYNAPLNARGYDLLFKKTEDTWILIGIWHTWIS